MICVASLPVDVRRASAIPAPARQAQKRIPLDPSFAKGEATPAATSPLFAEGVQGGFAFPASRRRQSPTRGDLSFPKVQAP